MAAKALLVFSLSLLILLNSFSSLTFANHDGDGDDDEDLSFLEEVEEEDAVPTSDPDPSEHRDFENYEDLKDEEDSDLDSGDHLDDSSSYSIPAVDDKDVVVLKESNFTEFIEKNRYVMVEFYAPWCGHCQALEPEYAAAATELKGEVVLAKVDATEETELAQKYEIQGFPTLYFFIDGVHRDYPGQRSKDGIVTWVRTKTGPGIYNLTTVGEAEQVLTAGSKVVLGFLDSLAGAQADELAAASRLEDGLSFYQTASPEVAKLFHIDPQIKRPALVLLKEEAEMISHFDGQFTKSAIAQFVKENKLPLVTTFTREVAPVIFENPIKMQLLLFATSNDSENLLPAFQVAAKGFKGKLIFVYVEMDNEDYGKAVSEYFGVSGDSPRVVAYTGNDDSRKFVSDGDLTLHSFKSFAEDFLEDKLKPFYKSDPIPLTNDGDVKVVVGNNFDEIVLDESKDVLLEIYAPWCGHCQELEPIYNKLGKHLRSIDSLVIAKMDGVTNEHPRAMPDGFPTLLFFPAGNKSFDPITVDTDRTVVAFYKFLKKHASIPFKLQKPAETKKSKDSEVTETQKINGDSGEAVKDEL